MTITTGDILAAIDLLTEVGNGAADLSPEQAYALRHAVGQVADEVKRVSNLLDTSLKTQLEQPRIFDGVRCEVVESGSDRWNHDAIAREAMDYIRAKYTNEETGEMPDMELALNVWQLFAQIYLNPSVDAKRRSVQLILNVGNPKESGLVRWHKTGTKIKETRLEGET